MSSPKIVAIAQATNLGDVISCLPMAGVLKQRDPQTRIVFIGRQYTQLVIESSRFVDEFLEADDVVRDPSTLSQRGVEVFLNPFLSQELGMAAKTAGVPVRIGNSRRFRTRKWANRFVFERSQYNPRHIANVNLRYLQPLGIDVELPLETLSGLIGLDFTQQPTAEIAVLLDSGRFNLIVHPKSNKSGREWPIAHFLQLAELLPKDRFRIFLTGLAKEREDIALHCPRLFEQDSVVDLMGKLDLVQFLALIKAADGLVGNSTGPLHLAAALGIHALGLFPGRDRANPRKWHPIGPKAEVITFRESCLPLPGRCPKKYSGQECSCMTNILPEQVATRVIAWAP